MFLGEHAHALDAKGRLTVPVRFRAELSAGLVITRGYEPCLVVYPLEEWSALAAKVAQMPKASYAARAYSRLVFGSANEETLDKMGRILIPAFLREYAGIAQEAVVVGVNTYFEIWNPERLRQAREKDGQALVQVLADVAQMGV